MRILVELVGIAGLLLILLGWGLELKRKREKIPTMFALLYAAGSLLLTIYSIFLNNLIFAILNACAFLLAAANLAGQQRKD
ncbi:MAG: hypothetical protein N3G80_01585 [Candidatus Micrarchaeota archaeon]|nr:hypothetical protein [Candidatus Micrarchaeota archaeon]